MNKTDPNPCPCGAYIQVEGNRQNKISKNTMSTQEHKIKQNRVIRVGTVRGVDKQVAILNRMIKVEGIVKIRPEQNFEGSAGIS